MITAKDICDIFIFKKKGLIYDKTRAYQRNYEHCTSDSA